MIEGGSKIFSNFINKKLFNKIILYQGPIIIGKNGISFFDKILGDNIDNKLEIELQSTEMIGKCVKSIYK